jgi:nucleoside-diphosphate-sugar epimerase
MRIVVTGATGNVGTSVLEALGADDAVESIVGIARRVPAAVTAPKTDWVSSDVARDPLVEHLRGADAVIHLAWAIQPSRDRERTRSTNVTGSRRVFEATAEAGVPALIHASSVGAYSPAGGETGPVDETWPTEGVPSSFYSVDKAACERLLEEFERAHPDVRVARLRPALIFKRGAGGEIRRLFAGPLLPRRLVRPRRIPLLPWIRGLRMQAVHTADVADAYRRVALGDSSGAFNIAADPVLDGDTLAAALDARPIELPAGPIRAAAAASWRLRLQPTPPGWVDMGTSVPLLSTRRARAELGWKPEHDARDAVRELLVGMADAAGEPTPALKSDDSLRHRAGELFRGTPRP